jgi:beta-lactamase superfamily II metal-dependent hydrolase
MWYVTHPDGDHNQGIVTILKYLDSRGPKPELERMIFNFPSERANSTVTKDAASYEMIDFINTNYPDVKYIKIHTGMVFNIGEVKVETLGTIENLFDANAKLNDEWDTNDTCVLLRFSFGGKSIMMEGDIGNDTNVQKFHIALYSKEFFKSDVLQIAHHGYNALTTLNSYCAPEYALVSNAASNMWDWYKNYWKNLVKDGNLHYAGDYTTEISVNKGQLSVKKLPR